jgi:hypothetical protein
MVHRRFSSLTLMIFVALVGTLLAATSARAGPLDDYRTAHDLYRAALQQVRVAFATGATPRNDRVLAFTTALNRLNDVTAIAERADFVALDPKVSKKLVKLDGVIRKDLEKGLSILLDGLLADEKAIKKSRARFRRVSKKGEGTLKILKKVPAQTAILFEKKARSAGLHPGGRKIVFKTFARGADGGICEDAPVVTVVNLSGNAVEPTSVIDLGNGKFSVLMGDAFGAARIEISMCGATDVRFLQNDGTPPPVKGGTPVQLTGSWSGTFAVTRPGLCKGVAGSWTATFAVTNNQISGNWDSDAGAAGAISGTLSGGKATFVVGAGGTTGLQGTVNGSKISGNFTDEECPDGSGRIRGTFAGGRN